MAVVNVVIQTNGHGVYPKFGAKVMQLLEYTLKGKLLWLWKQDWAKFSLPQGVIVRESLDVTGYMPKMQTEH